MISREKTSDSQKSIDIMLPVLEVANMSTEGIVDDQSGSQDTGKSLALETNTVETADTEEWMTMNQSPSGRKKIGKNSAALKGQMPPVTTSPSRYHVLSADLEEGEVEETRADSSDDEDSVDSESALEKKKQMEKAKTGKNKKSQKNAHIATNGTKKDQNRGAKNKQTNNASSRRH